MTATVRPATAADAAAIADVHVACWRESYAGILGADFLARLDAAEREGRWRRIIGGAQDLGTFVAVQDGAIVGFASACPQRHANLAAQGYGVEIATIYVLARAQRRGHGRRLLGAIADTAGGAAALWVFRDNAPACRFYAAMGGVACGEQVTDFAGQRVPEVAYGWHDLARRLKSSAC